MSAFSVLMSVYYKERAEFLCQSLDSVFAQTLPPSEVVLVEDGPLTPALDTVIERYQSEHRELKVVRLPVNGGLGKALNEGLKHCTHDIVARMDTDDVAMPERFHRQVMYMDSHRDVSVCGSWIAEFLDLPDNIVSVRTVPESHDDIYRFGQRRNPVNHPSVAFRKKAVDHAGGYQDFPLFEDYYLWVRMLMDGAKFHNIAEPLLRFRLSSDMYRRRGGWRYAKTEFRFQRTLMGLGYVTPLRFASNLALRVLPRVVPNQVRARIYGALRKAPGEKRQIDLRGRS